MSLLSGAAAGPIIGYLTLAFGWRPAFVIICLIGLVWMAVWLFVSADNPAKSRHVSAEERAQVDKFKAEQPDEEADLVQVSHGFGYYLRRRRLCGAGGYGKKEVNPAVVMMLVSIFFPYITGTICWEIIQDAVHTIHLVGSLSDIISPIVTGFIDT